MTLNTDITFTLRRLRKNKVTSAAAILSLALAMGACIAAFELVDALLLRPLPVQHPERLYALSGQEKQFPPREGWKYPLFREMRESVAGRASLLAISFAERAELTFHSDSEMEKANVQYVAGDMFAVFGLHPAAGRLLGENDDRFPGRHPVAVVSYDYWARRFARDPHVLGRTFRMTNNLTGTHLYQIVGVAQDGFTGTEPGKPVDVFMPAMMHWGIGYPEWALFRVFAQLAPGVSPAAVREHLAPIVAARKPPLVLLMDPASAGVSGLQKDFRTPLIALELLVALVLLIATANVANLMTAQSASRAREMALRVSIGASRPRLAQLVLVEALLLGASASILAWWFARWSAPVVAGRITPVDNPARLSLVIDWRVLLFAIALTLAVTLLFGLVPALRASAIKPIEALKDSADSFSRANWMRGLVAMQSAFCFLVIFVAGMFVATFDRLHNQYNGYSSDRLLNIDIVNPVNEPSSVWDEMVERLRTVGGVESVAYADWPLMDGYGFKTNSVSVNGGPPSGVGAWFMNVSPRWVDTMKIPFLAGRDFRPADLSPGAAIVNQSFARQFFAGENPIGRTFEGTSSWMRGQRFQIVGLVKDARYRFLRQDVLPVAYTPFNRKEDSGKMKGGTLVVRTAVANPLALVSDLRREIARARSDFRISNIRTGADLIDSQTIRERLLALLARFFGAVAILLAGIGMYGVLDYSVWRRRREIGIRLALGAQARDVAAGVTGKVFAMVGIGAVAGLAAGILSARQIAALLYEVQVTELGIIALPALAILGAAILAALPAVIRAVAIDPAALLRTE